MLDVSRWQAHGDPPPPGGYGPICEKCNLSTWVEVGGGGAADVYHPNIDVQNIPNVDVVQDLENGRLPLHNEHAERVKMIHIINHVSHYAAKSLLKESFRILKPGGSIYMMVSDTDFLFERIKEDGFIEAWLNGLYHAPTDSKEGFHKWAYNFTSIKKELEEAGFSSVEHLGFYNRWEFKCQAIKV